MIRAELLHAELLIGRLSSLPACLQETMEQAMVRVTMKLLRHVKENKLSDQVLRVRTGRLRRSINQRVETSGDTVTGFVGTNVEYAAAHEYGFIGTVGVREYLRTGKSGQKFSVRAHMRNEVMPARSFLRSALADRKDEIIAELTAAMQDAARKALEAK